MRLGGMKIKNRTLSERTIFVVRFSNVSMVAKWLGMVQRLTRVSQRSNYLNSIKNMLRYAFSVNLTTNFPLLNTPNLQAAICSTFIGQSDARHTKFSILSQTIVI